MVFVSVFPRRFGVLVQMMTSHGTCSLVVFLKFFLVGHMIITYEEPKKYLTV
jgi:hypothetical protein